MESQHYIRIQLISVKSVFLWIFTFLGFTNFCTPAYQAILVKKMGQDLKKSFNKDCCSVELKQ